jgi:uncharacterized protein (DUF433 family)
MSRKGKGRRKVQQACGLIGSDPEIMGGTPVVLGTRVPVDLIADMTQQHLRRRFSKATLP